MADVDTAVVETVTPPPLSDASQLPVQVESRGLTVITQAGDVKEAQAAADEASARIRPHEKPKIAEPTEPKTKRPRALEPGGERFEEAQRQKKELHERATKAEKEAADLKARVAELERNSHRPAESTLEKPAAAAATRADAGTVVPERFDTQDEWFKKNPDKTFDDFLDARDAWRDERAEQRRQQDVVTKAQTERANADLVRYATQANDIAAEEGIDFAQTLEAGLKDVPFRPELQAALLQSENGARVALHLARNPDVANRIARLAPAEIYRQVGILEGSLRSSTAPTRAVKRSSAPPPFQPEGGGSTTQTTEGVFESAERISKMTRGSTLAEWDRIRRAHGFGGRRRM